MSKLLQKNNLKKIGKMLGEIGILCYYVIMSTGARIWRHLIMMPPIKRRNVSMKKRILAGFMACTPVFAGGVVASADTVIDNGNAQMGSNQLMTPTQDSVDQDGGTGSNIPRCSFCGQMFAPVNRCRCPIRP